MTDTFSDQLATYRQRSGLSFSKLADGIGKSLGYVRKLELYDYQPPTFEICQQLGVLLELNPDELHTFMEVAFIERLGDDKAYFDTLGYSQRARKTSTPPPPETLPQAQDVAWQTWHNTPIIHTEIAIHIESIFSLLTKTFNCSFSNISTTKTRLSFSISKSPCLTDVELEQIKQYMSSDLKAKFPEFKAYPCVWADKDTTHAHTAKHQTH